ncbi:hypothetical protein [Rhodococcus sp. T2V]|uniref:hypothetical protein n=1 Tax=Rhodococcus sp. T2V TaxID=3034164 RepID=UPI0023E1FA71|nr:hypothetical protein [Rhodococcus sp. T2V]
MLSNFTLGQHSPLPDDGSAYADEAVDIGGRLGAYCPGVNPEFVFTRVLGGSGLDVRRTDRLGRYRDSWNTDPANVRRRRHYALLQQRAGVFTCPNLPKPAKRNIRGQEIWLMRVLGTGVFLTARELGELSGLTASTMRLRLRTLRTRGFIESDWRGHAALVIS